MTIEERRKAILRRVETCLDHEYHRGLAEELFSIADSWAVMAIALEEMAKTQREQLEMQKRMFVVPVQKQEKH